MIRTNSGWTYADAYGQVPAELFDKNFVTRPGEWFREVSGWSCGEPEGLYGQFRRFWIQLIGATAIPDNLVLGAELNIAHFGRFVIVEITGHTTSGVPHNTTNDFFAKVRVL